MRALMAMWLAVLWFGVSAAQDKVQLSMNLMVGGAASRIVTGKLKGEWASPEPIPVEIELRSSTYIVVANLTGDGDAVIQIQPQGLQVKGKIGETPMEWTITPSGDVIADWQGVKFDSSKLPTKFVLNGGKPSPLPLSWSSHSKVTSSPSRCLSFPKTCPDGRKCHLCRG